jgi:hypothetical protein
MTRQVKRFFKTITDGDPTMLARLSVIATNREKFDQPITTREEAEGCLIRVRNFLRATDNEAALLVNKALAKVRRSK